MPVPVDKAAMYSAEFAAPTAAVLSTVPAPAGRPAVTVHADWMVTAGGAEVGAPPPTHDAPPPS